MGRRSRKRPYHQGHIPLRMERLRSLPRTEAGRGGRYRVQEVCAREKTYRCPGCAGTITLGTWHVVVWPIDALIGGGVQERRHWHAGCWKARFGRSAY